MEKPVWRTRKRAFGALRTCAIIASVGLFAIGRVFANFDILLISCLLVFFAAFEYALEEVRRRCVSVFFYVTFFVFLLCRPTIDLLRGEYWAYFVPEAMFFAFTIIYFGLLAVHFGTRFAEEMLYRRGAFEREHSAEFFTAEEDDFSSALQKTSAIGFYASLAFSLLEGLERLIKLRSAGYSDMYAGYESSLPFFFGAIATLAPFFLCVYLATMPKKLPAFIALGGYVVSTAPDLLLGARNPAVLAVLFAWIYFIIRDYLDGTRYWLGKFERTCIAVGAPAAVLLLGVLNYTRADAGFSGGVFDLALDFFHKQGVSFNVLNLAFLALPALPAVVAKCYTFGGFVDYFAYGPIGRFLLGTSPLGDGNSAHKAIYGNSFAHSMSYIANPDYLKGNGYGSSFLLETYADFGYIGMVVFCFALGAFMACMIPIFRKNRFWRIFILNCLMSFFLIPRAEATGWLTFVVYIQFWVVLVFCYAFAKMFSKNSNVKIGERQNV